MASWPNLIPAKFSHYTVSLLRCSVLPSFPGSSPALCFCRILYEKWGEGLDDLIMCTMRTFMRGLGIRIITHTWRLRAFNRSRDLLTVTALDTTQLTGRSPREATANNCESWKRLLQHEDG